MKRRLAKDSKESPRVRFSEGEEDTSRSDGLLTDQTDEQTSEDLFDDNDDATITDASECPPLAHRVRRRSRTEVDSMYYQMINEKVVNDVTLEFFYKPHTVTVIVAICAFLLAPAFTREDIDTGNNALIGLFATGVLFVIISALAFPNGPFIRPHPVIWRIVFGLSVIYVMLLQFTLFQNYDDIKTALKWLDPKGLNKTKLDEKAYAENCSDVSLERIWSYMDIFAVAHFLGWAMKALLIRHSIICWYISISWEITEVVFAHLLPNFQECWWDAIILDVLLCNGLGIWFGCCVARFLEMRQYHWESIKDIKTTRGKFKRAVLQFTPESWIKVAWYTDYALRRTLAIYAFVMIWLVSELNTFFLKHVFAVDTDHPIVFWRIILIGIISAPSIRQFYIFLTDPRVKRLGMQSWVYVVVCVLEATICIKFGRPMFPHVKFTLITSWIAFLAVGTFACVWLSVRWARKFAPTEQVKVDGRLRECYLDSSYENLGAIADDVKACRKRLQISESDFT